MRLCSEPGCGRAVPDDVRFCDECRHDDIRQHSAGNTDRERYGFLYMCNRFQDRIRPKILQRDPFCKRCGIAPSVIVDHVVPAGVAIEQVRASGRYPMDKYAGFFMLSNLQGLCRSCHALKTIEDKTHVGEWPSVLATRDAQPPKRWTF
jgi:5-methylcytosine-specific restriction endonuclease McrA